MAARILGNLTLNKTVCGVDAGIAVPKNKAVIVFMMSSIRTDTGTWYLPIKRETMSINKGNKYMTAVPWCLLSGMSAPLYMPGPPTGRWPVERSVRAGILKGHAIKTPVEFICLLFNVNPKLSGMQFVRNIEKT